MENFTQPQLGGDGQDLVIAELSHRLANELTSLCAGLKLASKHIVSNDVRLLVDRSLESAEAFGRMNRALCQVARPGSSELRAVVANALEPLSLMLARGGTTLSMHIGKGDLSNRQAWVVTTIVVELVFNALKHARSLCSVSVTGDITDHNVFLTVVTVLSQDPVAELPASSAEHGSGLGLMLCRRLAALIDGSLRFETSQTGQQHTLLSFDIQPPAF